MKLFPCLSSARERVELAARRIGSVVKAVRLCGVECALRDLELYAEAVEAQASILSADYFEESETVAETLHRYARLVTAGKRQVEQANRERDSAKRRAAEAERELIEARDLTASRARDMAVRLGLVSGDDDDGDHDAGPVRPADFDYGDVNRRLTELLRAERLYLALGIPAVEPTKEEQQHNLRTYGTTHSILAPAPVATKKTKKRHR